MIITLKDGAKKVSFYLQYFISVCWQILWIIYKREEKEVNALKIEIGCCECRYQGRVLYFEIYFFF